MQVSGLSRLKVSVFSGALLIAVTNVNAMGVNIDFGPSASAGYTGDGVLGGGTWNVVDIGGATDLTLADGSGPSGIGIDTGGFVNSFSNLGNATYPGTNELVDDRIINFPAADYEPASFTVTGLTRVDAMTSLYTTGFTLRIIPSGGASATTDRNYSTQPFLGIGPRVTNTRCLSPSWPMAAEIC